ncbi:hypothetical protein ACT3S8_06335 [Halomonas sp. AOP42-D2-25]|uniref:hypothetical protein n=1 Tax=Halomonas sp. AOP42-D2-25 TaxID=3457666 RepID=UPI00403338A6
MSLAVYVGINKFKAESNAGVREQSAIEITLSDIAKGQPHTDKTSNAENQFLVIDTLNEEALASLKKWLKKDTKNECVIAWPQPDAWLAASLANGVAGEEALNDWLAQAKRLLALFRTARRQVTLVGYLPGCELKVVKAPLLGRCDNAIYQLAAAYMSSQSQSLRDTLAYLVASSQECPIEENGETEVTQAALGEYHARQAESEQGRRTGRALQEADASQERQQQHIARLKGELSRARDEHTLLLQQLQNTQQVVAERTNELQAQREIAKQGEERLQEREQQLQVLKQENEALNQAFDSQQKEKQDEHTLLLQQLQNTQQVVAERTNELQVQREIAKQGEERLQEREQQLQVLKQENEALNQALDSQQKEKEASQQALNTVQNERAQLLTTLQQTQQAYESLYIEQQTLPEQLSTNQQELVKSASDQAYLRQQLEKRQSELNTLRTESEQRIHRLERLVQWLRVHAQRHAIAAYRSSRGYKKALPKQIAALEASSLFDADWYCAQYPDVAQANIQPAEHFIKFGAIDGRHPGPLFSTEFYLTHYEDVAASGQHPLLHYLHYGKEENREIHPPHYQLSALQTIAKGANA